MTSRDCPAAYVAEILAGTRPRRHAGYGIEERQAAALESLDDEERRGVSPALWLGLVALVVIAFAVWGHLAPAGAPARGGEAPPRHGSAAVLPSDAELASLERRARDVECMRCWLDGFSRNLQTMPKEARR